MSSIERIPIFTEEVFAFHLHDHENWKKLIHAIITVEENKNIHKFSTELDRECNIKARRTAWDSHLQYPVVKQLDEIIKKVIFKLIKEQNFDAPYVTTIESWINWYSKNQFANFHNHIPSHLSAVYFVDVEKSKANFVINKPTSFRLVKKEDKNNFFYNTSKIINVKDGTVVFFPSYLDHFVTPNESQHKRVTVAFNYVVEYDKEERSKY